MKGRLPFALLALALVSPVLAFATTVEAGDFAGGTSSGLIAMGDDFIVADTLKTMILDREARHLTRSARERPGSATQALLLLIPAPTSENFAENIPAGIVKATHIPEPGSLGLLGVGLIGLAALVRWKLRGGSAPEEMALPFGGQGMRASGGWQTARPAASEANPGATPRAA